MILFVMPSLHAYEKITSFHSDIIVQEDGRLKVHETIKIVLPKDRHGIYRDFPTIYQGKHYNKHHVDFAVEKVLLNNQWVNYEVNDLGNGKRIKIGDPYNSLNGGAYTYDIFYTTGRQIGFFDTHDELYWNVTGNGWNMPLESVSAHVSLPVDTKIIETSAYTGYKGEKGAHYKATNLNDKNASWQTTKPLLPYEGLTIVLAIPKGVVHPPSFLDNFFYMIRDYGLSLIIILCFLATIIYIIYAYCKVSAQQKSGTIIPLFYPPHNFSPAYTRYILEQKYDHAGLAAEIVDLAVHGYLTIEYKSGYFSNTYILHKTSKTDADDKVPTHYKKILKELFAEEKSVKLAHNNRSIISEVTTILHNSLVDNLDTKYFYNFSFDYPLVFAYILIVIAGFISVSYLDDAPLTTFTLTGTAIVYVFLLIIFCLQMQGYTKAGKKLRDEIEGFKLYLKTAELEQMKVIGTPPTKTPELYEKYLPYAIALGVEEQWTAQFAPIFAQMMQAPATAGNYYYRPHWYSGDSKSFALNSFSSHISSSLQTSISASSHAPGSSSGSSGSGSSGGGGGGGGGGSW
jgi:uncharacterized membrane protein